MLGSLSMTLRFVPRDSKYVSGYSPFSLDLFLKNGMWEARCGWKLGLPEAELGKKNNLCVQQSVTHSGNPAKMRDLPAQLR